MIRIERQKQCEQCKCAVQEFSGVLKNAIPEGGACGSRVAQNARKRFKERSRQFSTT